MTSIPVYGVEAFTHKPFDDHFYANNLPKHLEDHLFVNHHHKHNTYVVVLFTQGSGSHTIDFTTYPVGPGTLFLLKPGQVHCWTLSSNTNGYVVMHTKDFFDGQFITNKMDGFPFFQWEQNNPSIVLCKETSPLIEQAMANITLEASLPRPSFQSQKLASLLHLLYIDLSRVYVPSETASIRNDYYAKVSQLLKLIDLHYVDKKSASDYADLLHMTTRHLSRICHETLQKSPSSLINARILLEAKRLLIHTHLPISVVADKLGYADTSYFIRYFRTQLGHTPKEFQHKLHKEALESSR